MRLRTILLAGQVMLGSAMATSPIEMDIPAMKATIASQHPAAYYELATRLFGEGQQDEAVFWYYAGQLRFRIHLACHPELKPDGDPAVFASLTEAVGRPINEYAFGDPPALAETIGKVLDWDAATENGFTPKSECTDAIAAQRAGLGELQDYVEGNADEIRRQRTANGLPNR